MRQLRWWGCMRCFFLLCLVISTLCVSGETQAGLLGPSNYEECITDGLRGIQSDVAAKAIVNACRQKFPEPMNIPNPCFDKIKGEGNLEGGRFYGTIYNGCSDWQIVSVTIYIQWEKEPVNKTDLEEILAAKYPELTGVKPDEYTIFQDIEPLKNQKFNIAINPESGNGYHWGISSAMGYKVKK